MSTVRVSTEPTPKVYAEIAAAVSKRDSPASRATVGALGRAATVWMNASRTTAVPPRTTTSSTDGADRYSTSGAGSAPLGSMTTTGPSLTTPAATASGGRTVGGARGWLLVRAENGQFVRPCGRPGPARGDVDLRRAGEGGGCDGKRRRHPVRASQPLRGPAVGGTGKDRIGDGGWATEGNDAFGVEPRDRCLCRRRKRTRRRAVQHRPASERCGGQRIGECVVATQVHDLGVVSMAGCSHTRVPGDGLRAPRRQLWS